MVSVSKFLLKDAARMVLDASDRALGPEELLSRARARFPDCELPEDPEELARRLTGVKGFYLLGPVLFGLRRHFSLPERVWKQAKNDSLGLLKREKRLLSTYEIIEQNRFPWVSKTNAHELGCILREDPRFVDMGRFLFSIKRWGIKKREFVKDLIPRILEEAGKPLTGAEIEQRLRKFRSVSAHTVKSQLTYHPELRRFGQNCHGLKSWR
jgi:hypothetical protein